MIVAGGAIATSDPRATEVGAEVLRAGGRAMDAAVAAALVLFVVEPQSCGPGGDGFIIHIDADGTVVALDGSGEVPAGLTDDALARQGLDGLPARGARTVTVPGALRLFDEALRRFGNRHLGDLAAPAVRLATNGFAVRPTLAAASGRAADDLASDPVLGPLYAPGGRALAVDEIVRNPALATCLTQVAEGGTQTLFGGQLGDAVAARVRTAGGYLSLEDLSRHRTVEVEPATAVFRGSTVWEMPAPTQGPAVTGALSRLETMGAAVDDWSEVVVVVGEAMAEAGFDLRLIGPRPRPGLGDTTYVAAMDAGGRAASLITSVFGDFGAHFGVPELGGPLGNRATMLRALGLPMTPGRRPPHTTIPAAVTRSGAPQFVLGVAGGFMQPQAQVQLLVHLLERGLEPQAAIDQPRFRILFGGALAVEAGHPLAVEQPEAAARPPGPEGFGAAQIVGLLDGTRLAAGADARRGGFALILA